MVLPFFRQNNTIFQRDIARPYIASVHKIFLDDENGRVLDWLAYSPDLFSI